MKRMKNRMWMKVALGLVVLSIVFVGFKKGDDFKIAKSLDIYYTLFREVNMFYVDETKPDKLVKESIDAMLESLDPYTVFIPEEDMDDFNFMTTGEYGGIGALIRKRGDYAVVSRPYRGFPADKAGLRGGDQIVGIDGKKVKDMSVTQVSENLKGIPKTKVKLEVKSPYDKKVRELELTREEIHVTSVPYYGLVDDKVGYILVTKFTKDVSQEIRKALTDLQSQTTLEGVIIDLRGNPGGLLIEAVELSNLFVEKGNEIVSTKGKVKNWNQTYYTTKNPVDTEIPMVVMVNRGSASASEIVAGAMQDLDRGVVLGERTFGKGLVQATRPLSYNAKLKVTTAKYYIPSGRCIQALDFTNRNDDGSVGTIPDSLISEFTTKNGRKVFDGGGVVPDVKIKAEEVSEVSIGLIIQDLIFDYASYYLSKNESIASVDDFKFTDEDYNDFLQFLEDKDFSYETRSEGKLKELVKMAKRERYYELAEEEFNELKEKLSHDPDKDLQTFKDEVIQFIKEEITGRYYYRAGTIKTSLKDDPQLDKAIEVLKDRNTYDAILSGEYKPEAKKEKENS